MRKHDERAVVRLTGALRDELKAAAERDGRPVSGLIRKILTDFVTADMADAAPPRPHRSMLRKRSNGLDGRRVHP